MPLASSAIAIDSGTVLVLITLLVAPVAAIAFSRSGSAWKSLGKGPFAIEQELPAAGAPPGQPLTARDRAAQEQEVRQMLEAKAERRRRRGGEPLDVEAETRRLLASPVPLAGEARIDQELRQEVRQLVVARNERLLRQGQPPLDVEAETERQLADFIGSN